MDRIIYFLFALLVVAAPTLDGRGMGARGFLWERTATNLELSCTRLVTLSAFGTNILDLTGVNLLRLLRTILRKVRETFERFVLSIVAQRSGDHEGYEVVKVGDEVASFADALWTRRAIFLLRDAPRRRLVTKRLIGTTEEEYSQQKPALLNL